MKTSTNTKTGPAPDPVFDRFMALIQGQVIDVLKDPAARLYTTDATGLFQAYLEAFPEADRQHHNCHACRRFIDTYGGLVTIDKDGHTWSPFWTVEDTPNHYLASVKAVLELVQLAKVTGIFYTKHNLLGTPRAGGWTHFSTGVPEAYCRLHNTTLTPGQARAEKAEDLKNVLRALEEFRPEDLAQAVRVLQSEVLYRSEKLLGAAEWLANLQQLRRDTKNHQTRNALTWRAIALAPAGFCHPRSGMLGTLLEDIQAGLSFEEIKRRFDDKMHPLRYQRPQAPPAAGNIAQAEKLVEQMGLAPSLKRRFARPDEVEAIWAPIAPKTEPPAGGVFGHLAPKEAQHKATELNLPVIKMTWEKFQRTVLPEAESMEFMVPHASANYTALVTAVDPEALPILQWDSPGHRNPVSWYVYNQGSTPAQWGLAPGRPCKVTAITYQPSAWGPNGSRFEHHGNSLIFLLDGAHDVRGGDCLALFPECLRSELHGIRATIEAFSKAGRLEPFEGPKAAGIRLQKGQPWSARFCVTSRGQRTDYQLDRWD